MSLNISALRQSFDRVAPQADVLAKRFYDRLFENYPHLLGLFTNTDFTEQRRKLIQSLTIVIKSLDQPETLKRVLHDLGARHVEYGVTEDDYPPVAETLLNVLADMCGPDWCAEWQTAWEEALTAVAMLMLEGAAAQAAPARTNVGAGTRGELAASAGAAGRSGGAATVAMEGRTGQQRGDLGVSGPAARESGQGANGATAQGGSREMGTTSQTTQSVDFFYSMVEHAPLAYLFVQPNGEVAYLNARGHEILRQLAPYLGVGPEQLVGRSVEQLFAALPALRSRSEGLRGPVVERVTVGPETVEIRLSPASDGGGRPAGVFQTWEIVTERVQSEIRNLESQARLDAIENSQAVIEFQPDGTIVTANDRFLRAFGYTREEIAGRHHRLLVDEAERSRPDYAQMWERLNRGECLTGEYRRLRKDGGEIWLQASYTPIADKSGRVVKVVKYASDITAAVQARIHRARLESMIENAPTNIMMADRSLRLTYMNTASRKTLQKLQHLLPAPVDQLVGQSIDIFHKHPEHQRRLLSDPSNLPHRAKIKLGDEILDLLVSAIVDKDGAYLGPMVTWDVITQQERTAAEMARIQNMMDNIPINVMLANRDHEVVYINPASRRTLKKLEHLLPRPVDELLGQKIDIFHRNPEHQRRIVSDPSNLPHRAQIRLGDETLELLVSAILDNTGAYVGPMITWEIITDRVKLADDFEREVKGVVQIVNSSASELQANSRGIAAMTEETARQSQVVAAASEQATKNVEMVSSSAEELSASIAEIARHVQDASLMTRRAVEEAEKTNVTIRDLGESSNEIGQVIKVITSIAQQTNLLALNATIEAARAGEAGKGFAVVANEVKELARQTAKATEEISQKIAAIQSATGGAADAIKSITGSISRINEIATTVASAVEEQTAATLEISRNVSEAARGTAEVSNNIAGVSQAAEEGGRGAAEMLSAANNLAQESTRLNQLTDEFLTKMRSF